MRPVNRMNFLRDIFTFSKRSSIRESSNSSDQQYQLLGGEVPSSEDILQDMDKIDITMYDEDVGLKEGGWKKKLTRRAIRRLKYKSAK
jgi:hypothetical protein